MNERFPDPSLLRQHFQNRRDAETAFALFVSGFVVFALNNTILFFVKDEAGYFFPRLFMRFLVSVFWIAAAVMGTNKNRTKRNQFLLLALVLYTIGDVVVFFSILASALFYGCGHLFLLYAIQQTTYFRKYQFTLFFSGILIMTAGVFHALDGLHLRTVLAILYGTICLAMMCASLSNRFYCTAGVVFLISDIAGLVRVLSMNNKVTYVLTSFIYYFAIFLLSASVYNESKKCVVTRGDLLKLAESIESHHVNAWLGGKWANGLMTQTGKPAYRLLEIVYDIRDQKRFESWLADCRYESDDAENKYYSEKFGYLKTVCCQFREDGIVLLRISPEEEIELYASSFGERRVGHKTIKCILSKERFPG